MAFIKGDEKIVYLKSGVTWVPIGCLTSNSMQEDLEFIPTTTRENAGWITSRPTNQSYSIEVEALKTREVGKYSYEELKVLKRLRTSVEWKLEDSVDKETGFAFISQIGETTEVGTVMTFSLTLIGRGAVSGALTTDPDPVATLDAPFLTFISAGDVAGVSRINMSWTVPASTYPLVSFKVYRDDVLYETVPVGTGTSYLYQDFGVISGGVYSYNVSAVDNQGTEGPLSNKIINPEPIEVPAEGQGDYMVYESWDGITGTPIPVSIKESVFLYEDGNILAFEATL